MELLSVGDHLATGQFTIHSRFTQAVNFESDRRLVTLVTEKVGAGPNNIVVAGVDFGAVSDLVVAPDYIRLDGHRLTWQKSMVYDAAWPTVPAVLARFVDNLAALEDFLRQLALPQSLVYLLIPQGDASGQAQAGVPNLLPFATALRQQTRQAVRQIFAGDLALGISQLKGCGPGLTPSGDDFLAGFLYGLYLWQKMYGHDLAPLREHVYQWAITSNLLAGTFLYHAKEGLVFARLKRFLEALCGGTKDELYLCTGELLLHGATSGADLAVGLCYTLRQGIVDRAKRWVDQTSVLSTINSPDTHTQMPASKTAPSAPEQKSGNRPLARNETAGNSAPQ